MFVFVQFVQQTNEENFIINCIKYEDVREKFLDEIKLVTNSKTILNNGSLRSLMIFTNPKIVKLFSFFFSVRTNTQFYT